MAQDRHTALGRGDRLPSMVLAPPGPRARRLLHDLSGVEAPLLAGGSGAEALAPLTAARGANVLDVDGNRYVDWCAGFGVAFSGHRPPEVVRAFRRQADELMHGLADAGAHPLRLKLARRLREIAPVPNARVHWAISGSDAVDLALKVAFLHTGRPGVLVFEPAYHGLGLGALTATSRPAFRRPFERLLVPGRAIRLPYGASARQLARALDANRPGAVLFEPVVGREGICAPPDGWIGELARLATRRGVLVVADEVLTGGGRTGRWFAVEHDGVQPDLVCCGKVISGGTPLAAVLGRAEVLAALDRGDEAIHTSTFLAHPPACAAALANLRRIARMRLLDRASAVGGEIEAWARDLKGLATVSGRGALYGMRLGSAATGRAFARRARAAGFLVLASGATVQLTPPATLTSPQLHASLDAFERVLRAVSPA